MTTDNYRIITCGDGNERREYFSLNKSDLFLELPKFDAAEEQKKSFFHFLNSRLKDLLFFYFPTELKDHNNLVKINVTDVIIQEPDITPKEAKQNSLTWSYKLFWKWNADWTCLGINIALTGGDINEDVRLWVEASFKIGPFDLENVDNKNQVWLIKEKKGSIRIKVEVKESKEDKLFVSFNFQQEKEVLFCNMPKITERGNFIVNGHEKAVVCQSVRAPSVYVFLDPEQKKFFLELIPQRGVWISFSQNLSNKKIELKFLNSKKTVPLRQVLEQFEIPSDLVNLLLLNSGDEENEEEEKIPYTGQDLPRFIFSAKNSYFEFGELGRKKFNKRILLRNRLLNQTLGEDVLDAKKKPVFVKGTLIDKDNIEKLEKVLLENGSLNSFLLPHTEERIFWVKVKSAKVEEELVSVLGIIKGAPLSKVYFDLADLFCLVSLLVNIQHGIGNADTEESKDDLKNQIVRRVGDLLCNILESKLGGFLLRDMPQKYPANISQLKKTDLTRMPNLQDFNNLLKSFFNTSPLVQLQNQNNPLSEIAYVRKISVFGLGGFNQENTTLSARNINESHWGRYGFSTSEGKNLGLSHNLALRAVINELGQIIVPYYLVKNGTVIKELIYLTSEEESDYYISHCNVRIDKKNKLLDEDLWARHQGRIMLVPRKLINLIDSSFFSLTSAEESLTVFSPHTDPTRILMACNMKRGAIAPLKSQAPLIASGAEGALRENSALALRAEADGRVEYVDSLRIVVKEDNSPKKKRVYELEQMVISNKNILNFSTPLVRKGDAVKKGQIISDGHYSKNGELALGCNLRVVYLSSHYNFEDAIVVNERLIKEETFVYGVAQEYNISRYNTPHGPEVFSSVDVTGQKTFSHLDNEGIVKEGSVVHGNYILVQKITPQMSVRDSEAEMLLYKLLGGKGQKYSDSSLYLPRSDGDNGLVYKVERLPGVEKNELEKVRVFVLWKRNLENGDKLTSRHANKGVIRTLAEADMPFDENGSFDMVCSSQGVPSRLNAGQLLEVLLAEAADRLGIKMLIRPYNTIPEETVEELAKEAGIENMGNKTVYDGKTNLPFDQQVYVGNFYVMMLNHKSRDKKHARATAAYSIIHQQPLKGRGKEGGLKVSEMDKWCGEAHGAAQILMRLYSSDDIRKRQELQNSLLFGRRKLSFLYNRSESLNLIIQYLWCIGFNLEAKDFQGRSVDFYKFFSK